MSTFYDLKNVFISLLIKMMIKKPSLMENKIFLKVMQVFPEKISGSYERKFKADDVDYMAALKEGLLQVNNSPQKILDLCTGPGGAVIEAALRFPRASIIGLDQSSGMINIACDKQSIADRDRIRFVIGDARKTDFHEKEFDLIISSNAPVYLSEIGRVLKPGGELLVTFSLWGDVIKKFKKEVVQLLEGNGFILDKLELVGRGAFILGKKKNGTEV